MNNSNPTTATKTQGKPTRQKKLTEYGVQLQEKQKARRNYGLREAQFRKYFEQASKFAGKTGDMLLTYLEQRLDNVIFRAGFTLSRRQARQMINHRHFVLNGVRVSIPSIQVKNGDIISLHKPITLPEHSKSDVSWLTTDTKKQTITVKELPSSSDLPIEFDTQKIIEFYSR